MTQVKTVEARHRTRPAITEPVISCRQYFVQFLRYVEELLPLVGVSKEHGPTVIRFLACRFGRNVLPAKTEADLNNMYHKDACEILRLVKSRKGKAPPRSIFPDRISFEAFLRKLGDQASCFGLKPGGIDRIRAALEENLAQGLPADSYAGKVFPDRSSLEFFMDSIDDLARDYGAGPEGACRIYQVVRVAIEKNFGQGLPEEESDMTLFPNKFSFNTFLGRVAQITPDFGVEPKSIRLICDTLTRFFGTGFGEGGTPRNKVRQRQRPRRAAVFQNQDCCNRFLREVEGIASAVGVKQGGRDRLRQVLVERFGQD